MRRACTLVLACTAVLGCGGGDANNAAATAAAQPDAKKADEGDAKAPESAPPPSPAPESEPPPMVDAACGTYVTEADVEQACGVDVTHEVTRGEGNQPLNTCSRKFRGPDDRSISFKLAIHESAEKVGSLPWKGGATAIPDLGDSAHAYVEDKAGQFDWHTVEVRIGDRILYLRSINTTGGQPLCPTEKLAEVARRAAPRIQTSQ